nr:hypothetical protein [Vibrio furnissii]
MFVVKVVCGRLVYVAFAP